MFKKLLIPLLVVASVLALSLPVLAATTVTKVSPITDAAWLQINFDKDGQAFNIWETDVGPLATDANAYIENGRVMVPFRWAIEPLGGIASYTTRFDGTVESVRFDAPKDIVVTETNTVTVTVTVEVPIKHDFHVVNNGPYSPLIFRPAYSVEYWGFTDSANEVWVNLHLPNGAVSANQIVFPDLNGYFRGSFLIPVDAVVGTYVISAYQFNTYWTQSDTFVVLPVLPTP